MTGLMLRVVLMLITITIIGLFILLKYVEYYINIPKIVKNLIIFIVLPLLFATLCNFAINMEKRNDNKVDKITDEFISNQNSEYSQLWLDFLSYRDYQIGMVGSEEKFNNFLKEKNMTEKDYALEVIKGMLEEQGITDMSIAEKCVNENIGS